MIPLCEPYIKGNELKYITECINTNYVSSIGGYVDLFEKKFSKYIGSKYAISAVNGTSALHLALMSIGIKEGDEVIVPSFTFVAPVNAIIYCGAKPVFADVSLDTWTINPREIKKLITPKTRAILPVHIYGKSAEMSEIISIAKEYGLFVIEDASESLGAVYKGKKTGSLGDIGCFSFNGNKIITTGSGGMLVSDNAELAERASYLSKQSKTLDNSFGFLHNDVGYNYRMSNLLAAMGIAQLENISSFVSKKRNTAKLYNKLLNDISGITLPREQVWGNSSFWLYSILVDKNRCERDTLIKKLLESNIESRPFFNVVHSMKPYANYKQGNLDNSVAIALSGINLPSSVGIKEEDIIYVTNVLRKIL